MKEGKVFHKYLPSVEALSEGDGEDGSNFFIIHVRTEGTLPAVDVHQEMLPVLLTTPVNEVPVLFFDGRADTFSVWRFW